MRARLRWHQVFALHAEDNIGVVEYRADHIAVMQHVRLVEIGASADVLPNPKMPYTQALLAAVPRVTVKPAAESTAVDGSVF